MEHPDGTAVLEWEVADRYQLLLIQPGQPERVLGEAPTLETLPYAPMPHDWDALYEVRAFRGEDLLAASTVGKGDPRAKAAFTAYAEDLEKEQQGWGKIAPVLPDETLPGTPVSTIVDGRVKTVTPMQITRTPGELITFNAGSNNTLWPGSIVQGKEAAKGQLVSVGISETRRNKVKINVTGLTTNPTIEPVVPTWSDTLNEIKKSVKDAAPAGRNFYLNWVQAQTSQQVCLELGVSANTLNFEGSINVAGSHKQYSNTVVAYVRETAYTASVSITDLDDFFNDDFTESYFEQLKGRGKIGPENPPLYVSSVIYGRILYFAVSTEEKAVTISAAIAASYNGWANLSATVKAEYQQLLSNAKVTALGVGCPGNLANLLPSEDGFKKWLGEQTTAPDQYGVVGYVLKTFEDKTAKQSETSRYNQTVWSKNTMTVEVFQERPYGHGGPETITGTWSFPGGTTGTFRSGKRLDPAAVSAPVAFDGDGRAHFEADLDVAFDGKPYKAVAYNTFYRREGERREGFNIKEKGTNKHLYLLEFDTRFTLG